MPGPTPPCPCVDAKPAESFTRIKQLMSHRPAKAPVHPALRHARRVVVAIIGGTVFVIGILLIVLPGPAFVVIPAGLAILAIEFEWSRRWLGRVRAWVRLGRRRLAPRRSSRAESSPDTP